MVNVAQNGVLRALLHIAGYWLWPTGHRHYCMTFSPSRYSPAPPLCLWPKGTSATQKGLAEITTLRSIENHLPRGKFDWLERGVHNYFLWRMEKPAAERRRCLLIIHIYTSQTQEQLYLHTFHLFLASYLLHLRRCFSFFLGLVVIIICCTFSPPLVQSLGELMIKKVGKFRKVWKLHVFWISLTRVVAARFSIVPSIRFSFVDVIKYSSQRWNTLYLHYSWQTHSTQFDRGLFI